MRTVKDSGRPGVRAVRGEESETSRPGVRCEWEKGRRKGGDAADHGTFLPASCKTRRSMLKLTGNLPALSTLPEGSGHCKK